MGARLEGMKGSVCITNFKDSYSFKIEMTFSTTFNIKDLLQQYGLWDDFRGGSRENMFHRSKLPGVKLSSVSSIHPFMIKDSFCGSES